MNKLITYIETGKAREATDLKEPNFSSEKYKYGNQWHYKYHEYNTDLQAYNAHIESLPKYDVAEPSGWVRGQDYEENVHFKFEEQVKVVGAGWIPVNQDEYERQDDKWKRTIIVPIAAPIEGEREDEPIEGLKRILTGYKSAKQQGKESFEVDGKKYFVANIDEVNKALLNI